MKSKVSDILFSTIFILSITSCAYFQTQNKKSTPIKKTAVVQEKREETAEEKLDQVENNENKTAPVEKSGNKKEKKKIVKLTLVTWKDFAPQQEALKDIVKKFNEIHKDVQLDWVGIENDYESELKRRIMSGEAADLVTLDIKNFDEFVRADLILPLNYYLQYWRLADFPEIFLNSFSYNGKLYGIAKDFAALGIFINKKMFDDVGVSYPQNGMSYEDFFKKLEELKAKGVQNPLVYNAGLSQMIPFIIAHGGRLVDENFQLAFNEEKTKEAIKKYIELASVKRLATIPKSIGAEWDGDAFCKGLSPILWSGAWCLDYIKKCDPELYKNLEVLELPVGENKSNVVYATSWSISKHAKNIPAAVEVLKYLSIEGQKIFIEKNDVPSTSKSLSAIDTNEKKMTFYKGLDYGTAWHIPIQRGSFGVALKEINKLLENAILGKITSDEFIEETTKNYEQWIREGEK